MAAVDMAADMPMSPQEMWDHVSDLSDLGNWFVMNEGWRSEVPEELTEGTQVVGVARAKGFRNRVTWTVTKWDPPHQVALSGSGKGGAKYAVTLTARAAEEGSTLGLRLEAGRARVVRSGGLGSGSRRQRGRGEVAEAVHRAVRVAAARHTPRHAEDASVDGHRLASL